MENSKLRKVYDTIVKEGYDVPDFATFETDMRDDNKLTQVRDRLVEDGYELPEFGQFKIDMFGAPQEKAWWQTEVNVPKAESPYPVNPVEFQGQVDQEEKAIAERLPQANAAMSQRMQQGQTTQGAFNRFLAGDTYAKEGTPEYARAQMVQSRHDYANMPSEAREKLLEQMGGKEKLGAEFEKMNGRQPKDEMEMYEWMTGGYAVRPEFATEKTDANDIAKYNGYSANEINAGMGDEKAVALYTKDILSPQLKAAQEKTNAMLKERDAEIEAANREREESMPWYVRAGVNMSKGGTAGMPSYVASNNGRYTDHEWKMLSAAANINKETEQLVDAAVNDRGFFAGFGRTLANIDTWFPLMSGLEMSALMELKNIDPEKASPAQKALMEALAMRAAAESAYSGDISRRYKIGEGVANMVPLWFEMAFNPLSGVGKAAAKKVAKGVMKSQTKKALAESGKTAMKQWQRRVLAKGTGGFFGSLAGGAGMAATTSLPKVAVGAGLNSMGQAQYDINAGGVEFDSMMPGGSYWSEFGKEFARTAIGHGTEQMGAEWLGKALGKPLKWVGKGVSKIPGVGKGVTRTAQFLEDLGGEKYELLKNLAKDIKYGGPIEELGEEFMSVLLTRPIDDDSLKKFFEKDNLLVTLGTVVTPFGVGATMAGGYNALKGNYKAGAKEWKKREAANYRAQNAFGEDQVEWRNIMYNLNNPDTFVEEMQRVYNSPDYTEEQKKNALEYAVHTLRYMAATGSQIDLDENTQMLNGMLRESYGWAYDNTAPEAVNGNMVVAADKALRDAESAAKTALGLQSDTSIEDFIGGRSVDEVAMGDDAVAEALRAYYAEKALFEGMQDKMQDTRESEYMEADKAVDAVAHEDGNVYRTTLPETGETIFITGGKVVLDSEGYIDVNQSEGLVALINGEHKAIQPGNLREKVTVESVEAQKAAKRAEIDARYKQQLNTFTYKDEQGNHTIQLVTRGEEMSRVLLDGVEQDVPNNVFDEIVAEATESGKMEGENGNVSPVEENAPIVEQAETTQPIEQPELSNGLSNETAPAVGAQPQVELTPKQKREEVANRIPMKGKERAWTEAEPADVAEYISLLTNDPAKQQAAVDKFIADIKAKQEKVDAITALEMDEDIAFWDGVKQMLAEKAAPVAEVAPVESAPVVEETQPTAEVAPTQVEGTPVAEQTAVEETPQATNEMQPVQETQNMEPVAENVETEPINEAENVNAHNVIKSEDEKKVLRKRAEKWAKKLGVKINVLESYDEVTDEQAKVAILEQRVPGWFAGGEVYVYMPHVKNGVDLDKTVVHETVAHKGIKQMLGEQWEQFLDNVWEMMSVPARAKFLSYVGAGKNATLADRRAAADEYVAALAEKVYKKQGMTAEEKNIWQKIADWFRKKFNVDEAKAEVLSKETLTDEDIAKMIRASYETLQSNKVDNEVASVDGDRAMFSLGTYRDQGRDVLENYLGERVKGGFLTEGEALEMMAQMDDIYEICEKYTGVYEPFGNWSEAEVISDKDGKPVFSVIKSNGDYHMNLDFSLVCKKRRTLDAVFDEMISRGIISSYNLDQVDIAKINAIIREFGFETACRLCFVDAKRFRVAKVADVFCEMYNELSAMDEKGLKAAIREEKKNTVRKKTAKMLLEHPENRVLLSRDNFMSAKGFDNMKINKAEIMTLYNSKKGTGGPKASSGDVQYMNDVLDANWTPEKAYAVGGVRLQSFSDYVPRMVFDYIQLIADLAAKDLPVHAYTKEPLFAKTFGLTGVKVNLSLVPRVDTDGVAPGLDANGDYAWQEGETFPYEEAIALQNAPGYKDNCGTIAVGVSDEHILKMLGDENIRMVIPYHKSGLNHMVAEFNNIDKFVDYTNEQNTRDKNGKRVNDKSQPNFNQDVHETNDPRGAAQRYLDWCDKKGYLPKFDKFRDHPNYYKLLEDFTTIVTENGVDNVVPQGAVQLKFPTEQDAFGSLDGIIREGLEEDAVLEGRRSEKLGEIVDAIEEEFGERTMFSKKSGDEHLVPRLNKNKVEKIFGGIWIEDKEEFAKFVSAVNNYAFEENGQGIAYTDDYFYAYYLNIDGQVIPFASVALSAEESQEVVNQVNQEIENVREGERVKKYIDTGLERAWSIQDKDNAQPLNNSGASNRRRNGGVVSDLLRKGRYFDNPSLYVKTERIDKFGFTAEELEQRQRQAELSKQQKAKAQEVLTALKDAGYDKFHIVSSITEYGVSTYIVGDMFTPYQDIKLRISDHAVTSERRMNSEFFYGLDSSVSEVADKAIKAAAIAENADKAREASAANLKSREDALNEKWERIKDHFNGLAFYKTEQTNQNFEEFSKDPKKSNIMQTDLGDGAYSYEYTAPTTAYGAKKPSAAYIEAFNEEMGEVETTRFRRANKNQEGQTMFSKRMPDKDAPIKEHTRTWAERCQEENPKLWNEVVDALKVLPEWGNAVDADARAMELLESLCERENYSRVEKEMKTGIERANGVFEMAERISSWAKVKAALKSFWNWVQRNVFHTEPMDWQDFVDDVVGRYYGVSKVQRLQERIGSLARDVLNAVFKQSGIDIDLAEPVNVEQVAVVETENGEVEAENTSAGEATAENDTHESGKRKAESDTPSVAEHTPQSLRDSSPILGERTEASQAPAQRNRNMDREAWKKVFKKGGEKAYDLMYELHGGIVSRYPKEFLEYLKEKIGVADDVANVIEAAHQYLVYNFQKKRPDLFPKGEKAHDVMEVHELLATKGYSMLEHTIDNGKAIGVKMMYRDKFIPSGKTDTSYTPEGLHGRSVICYYGNPELRLAYQYVFTVTKDNATETPTAYELAADPSLMTPEWAEHLEKIGRKNEDGTYNLEGLTPNFSDPFSLSHLMIRIGKEGVHDVEIISRYNHGAFDASGEYRGIDGQPNATLGGDLDKLVAGLHDSLMEYKNLDPNDIVVSEGVKVANDGKVYRYSDISMGYFFGDGFYIDYEGNAHVIDKNKERMYGMTVITKDEIYNAPNHQGIPIHKVTFTNNGVEFYTGGEEVVETREIEVKGEKKIVEKKVWKGDKKNSFRNGVLTTEETNSDMIDNMVYLLNPEGLTATDITSVNSNFLARVNDLKALDMPNLEYTGSYFAPYLATLRVFNAPKLKGVGDGFLMRAQGGFELNLPNLVTAGNSVLAYYGMAEGNYADNISLPNLGTVGDNFMVNAKAKHVDLPNLGVAGFGFMRNVAKGVEVNVPNLWHIADDFLGGGWAVKSLNAPMLRDLPVDFMMYNDRVKNDVMEQIEQSENKQADEQQESEETRFRKMNEHAEEFNKTHKGGVPVVEIDPNNMEAELAEEGFTTEEIDELKKRMKKGAGAFYNPDRNLIYLLDPTLDKERVYSYCWHEDTHVASVSLGVAQELKDEFYSLAQGKKKENLDAFLKALGYEKKDYPEESMAHSVQAMAMLDKWEAGILSKLTGSTAEGAQRQMEIIQPLIDYINNGRQGNQSYLREDVRNGDVYDTASNEASRRAKEEGASETATGGLTEEVNSQEGETLFRKAEQDSEEARQKIESLDNEVLATIEELAQELYSNVGIITDIESIPDEKKRKDAKRGMKGWYDPATGVVAVVLPNIADKQDAVETMLHEIVGHKGLRGLLGEKYNEFLNEVFVNAPKEMRADIMKIVMAQKADGSRTPLRTAVEEYLAGIAEGGFANNPTLWTKIMTALKQLLRSMGVKVDVSENELAYMLWRSHKLLKGGYDLESRIIDSVMKQRMEVGEYRRRRTAFHGPMRSQGRNLAKEIELFGLRDEYEKMILSTGFQSREAFQDSMFALKKFQEMLEKATGKKLPDYFNAYYMENALSSANQAQAEAYGRLFYKKIVDEVNALKEMFEQEDIFDYLIIKHGIERNREMAVRSVLSSEENGLDRKMYNKYVAKKKEILKNAKENKLSWEETQRELDELAVRFGADLSKDYSGLSAIFSEVKGKGVLEAAYNHVLNMDKKGDFANLHQAIKAATDETLEKRYSTGMLSKKTKEEILDMYEYYVPLRGFEEQTSEDVYHYMTTKSSPISSVKAARGRTSKSDNAIAWIANAAEEAIVRGNRNMMMMAFFNAVAANPNDLVSIEGDTYLELKNGQWTVAFPDIPVNATPEQVREIWDDFIKEKEQQAKKNPDMVKKVSDNADIPYTVVQQGELQEHQIFVRRNGRLYTMTVNGNPRLAQAINGVTNPNTTDSKLMNKIADTVQSINSGLSRVYTTANPDFVLSNWLRDMIYSNSMVWVKESPAYAWKFNKNCGLNARGVFKLISKYENGTLDMKNDVERMFHEFITYGGETGYTQLKDYEASKKELQKMLKKGIPGGATAAAVQHFAAQINRAVENAARFAAFRTSREMGRSITRSVHDAKEISVNFNKKGAGARFFGAKGQTKTGSAIAAISGIGRGGFVFWNAGVQGMYNFFSALYDHKAKGAAMIFAPLLLGYLAASMGDDDDDYQNLSPYIRRSNLCFKLTDGTFLTIPLPIEYRAIYGTAEYLANIWNGKEEFNKWELAGQLSQLLPLDMLEGGGGFKAFVPSLLKPVFEVAVNKDWTGRPIAKQNDFNRLDPEYMRTYDDVSAATMAFSKMLNEIGGGNKHRRADATIEIGDEKYEPFEWNPAYIENTLRGYLGGVFSFPEKVAKTAGMIAGKREFDWRHVPLANRILKTSTEKAEEYKVNSNFFDNLGRFEKDWHEMRGWKKDAFDFKGTEDERESALTRYGELLDKNGKLRELYIIKSQIDKSNSLYKEFGEEAFKQQMLKYRMEFNKKFNEIYE